MELKIKNKEINGTAIVKLSYGDKFIITKTRNILFLQSEISKSMGMYRKKKLDKSKFYYLFAKYLCSVEAKRVMCEKLFESENGYEVLKKELEILIELYPNSNCTNQNNIPYLPKTVRAAKGSNWLKQNEYLNFMKLLKGYDY
jgi:hypothetical protein